MEFIIYSNTTELVRFSSLKEAKLKAKVESLLYDDIITISSGGLTTHMAQGGLVFRLVVTR